LERPDFFFISISSFSLCLILSLFVYLILAYSVFNEHCGFRLLLTAFAVLTTINPLIALKTPKACLSFGIISHRL